MSKDQEDVSLLAFDNVDLKNLFFFLKYIFFYFIIATPVKMKIFDSSLYTSDKKRERKKNIL